MPRLSRIGPALLASFAIWTSQSLAQTALPLPVPPSVQSSAEQIVAALLPAPAGGDATRGVQRDQAGNVLPEAPRATLLVTFEPETDRLTVAGMRSLRELAAALQDPRLAQARFQVVGHGYAQGDPQLQVRTARRAQSVVEHLAGFYSIDFTRLMAAGAGAAFVANPMVPDDPLNKRIEIINLSMQ